MCLAVLVPNLFGNRQAASDTNVPNCVSRSARFKLPGTETGFLLRVLLRSLANDIAAHKWHVAGVLSTSVFLKTHSGTMQEIFNERVPHNLKYVVLDKVLTLQKLVRGQGYHTVRAKMVAVKSHNDFEAFG